MKLRERIERLRAMVNDFGATTVTRDDLAALLALVEEWEQQWRELQITAHGDSEPGAEYTDWGYIASVADPMLALLDKDDQ